MADLADALDALAAINHREICAEMAIARGAREKHGKNHPEIDNWDYRSLCFGLIQNVFTTSELARDFVDWAITRMTPKMLKELRSDSDRFQDFYSQLYFEDARPTDICPQAKTAQYGKG